MKFSKYFLLLCSFSIYVSLANEPLTIRLSLIGNDTIVFNKLAFGFHSDATNGLDTALGELDLPPLLPPSGYKLYGVFIFYDSTQGSNIWSYLDLVLFQQIRMILLNFCCMQFENLELGYESIGIQFPTTFVTLGLLMNILGHLFK